MLARLDQDIVKKYQAFHVVGRGKVLTREFETLKNAQIRYVCYTSSVGAFGREQAMIFISPSPISVDRYVRRGNFPL